MDNSKPYQPLPGQENFPFGADSENDRPEVSTDRAIFGTPGGEVEPQDDDAVLDALLLPQNYDSLLVVQKAFTKIPIRKPSPEWFVRTHPSKDYRLVMPVLEFKESSNEIWVLAPSLAGLANTEKLITIREMVTSITRQGTLFLWPLKRPGLDGKSNDWNDSAYEIAQKAQEMWVRIQSDQERGAYTFIEAPLGIPGPVWPKMTFREILTMATRGKIISNLDHPILKDLGVKG
jgi:hypothetical protein